MREGEESWGKYDHAYFNQGYIELGFGLWPVRAQDAYFGPFHVDASAPAPLVVATTYDPATPYRGALRSPASSATRGCSRCAATATPPMAGTRPASTAR